MGTNTRHIPSRNMTKPIRAVLKYGSSTFRFTMSPTSTVADLANDAAEVIDLHIDQMRLIANGRELEPKEPLSLLGEFWFISNAVHLVELDKDACREWQKTGRCRHGQRCPKVASHDMHHSPRYVAHQSLESSPHESPRGVSKEESPCASPPSSSVTGSTPAPSAFNSNQNVLTPEGETVCRYWLQGNCRFGERCHFASTHKAIYLPKSEATIQSSDPPESHWASATGPEQTNALTTPVAADLVPQEYDTYLDEKTGHRRLKGGAMEIRDPTAAVLLSQPDNTSDGTNFQYRQQWFGVPYEQQTQQMFEQYPPQTLQTFGRYENDDHSIMYSNEMWTGSAVPINEFAGYGFAGYQSSYQYAPTEVIS